MSHEHIELNERTVNSLKIRKLNEKPSKLVNIVKACFTFKFLINLKFFCFLCF